MGITVVNGERYFYKKKKTFKALLAVFKMKFLTKESIRTLFLENNIKL